MSSGISGPNGVSMAVTNLVGNATGLLGNLVTLLNQAGATLNMVIPQVCWIFYGLSFPCVVSMNLKKGGLLSDPVMMGVFFWIDFLTQHTTTNFHVSFSRVALDRFFVVVVVVVVAQNDRFKHY
jgi:hypothetical protein